MKLIAATAVLALAGVAFADDLVTLRDGRTVSGTLLSAGGGVVTLRDNTGARQRFNQRDVRSIEFDASGPSAGVLGPGGAASRERYGATRAAGDRLEIPSGTDLTVRTNEEINTDTASTGRTYSAQVDRDVMVNGQTFIPRGSPAELIVRDIKAPGTVSSGEVQLDVQSISVNGRRYLVSTQDIERSGSQGIGKNRRTAEMVGGGAAVGAIIGAIAGGGKGAAIGGAVGAAAGAGAQVLTKGKRVNVPAESVLTFRLDRPVYLVQ